MNQINQFVALMALSSLNFIVTLATYWFVFGLWPRSWVAFVFFGAAQAILLSLINLVSKSKP